MFKILYIEDDPDDFDLLEESMPSDVTLIRAESVDDAGELLREHSFDLIVLDLNLTLTKGLRESLGAMFALLRAYKSSAAVVVFTTKRSREDAILAVELGAEDYLFKPTDDAGFEEVAHRLKLTATRCWQREQRELMRRVKAGE